MVGTNPGACRATLFLTTDEHGQTRMEAEIVVHIFFLTSYFPLLTSRLGTVAGSVLENAFAKWRN